MPPIIIIYYIIYNEIINTFEKDLLCRKYLVQWSTSSYEFVPKVSYVCLTHISTSLRDVQICTQIYTSPYKLGNIPML